MKFPNKKLERAYEKANGHVFTKRSTDKSFRDENGDDSYDHVAMNWLEDHGIISREMCKKRWIFFYKICK